MAPLSPPGDAAGAFGPLRPTAGHLGSSQGPLTLQNPTLSQIRLNPTQGKGSPLSDPARHRRPPAPLPNHWHLHAARQELENPPAQGAPTPARPTARSPPRAPHLGPAGARASRPAARFVPARGPAAAQRRDLPMAAPKKGRKPGAGEPGSRDPPGGAGLGGVEGARGAGEDLGGSGAQGWVPHPARRPPREAPREAQRGRGLLEPAGEGTPRGQAGGRAGSSQGSALRAESVLILSEPPASRPRPDSARDANWHRLGMRRVA